MQRLCPAAPSCAALIMAGVMSLSITGAFAQDETPIRAGDIFKVEVFQHEEMSREVEVREDGSIEFPPVGELRAQGLNPVTLGQRIADGLSPYIRETAYVTVRPVYPVTVNGHVARPGRISFEKPPTLIEALLACGGPLPGALLQRVGIYRQGEQDVMQVVDVAASFAQGSGAPSPALRRNDIVYVPSAVAGGGGALEGGAAAPGGAPGGPGAQPSVGGGTIMLSGVAVPGVYPIAGGGDVYELIARAGGPAMGTDLGNARVISNRDGHPVVFKVNLASAEAGRYLRTFQLQDGDVIALGDEPSTFDKIWDHARSSVLLIASITGILLAYQELTD